jgi:2-isopropylmalate synthase
LAKVVSRAPRLAPSLEIYDTTLRDGAQSEDVSFSAEDKVRVAQKLDELGVHYIEGGWPGANPRDIEFFRMIKTVPMKSATVIAFGSTRKASNPVQKDANMQARTWRSSGIPSPI